MTYLTRPFAMAACILALLIGTQVVAQEPQDADPSLSQIVDAWLASPHGAYTSEAFTHWNEDGEIPGTCAVCHSSVGAIDYLRGPMMTPSIIEMPVHLGTSVDCATCHNSAAADLVSVPFPSGVSVDTFGPSAVCTVCHQGRASTQTVETAVSGLEDDVISGDLSFINVHYAPSAASLMGSVVQGGFEYPVKVYKGQFTHVPDQNTCVGCHQPHSLEVRLEGCTSCHQGVGQLADIRISPIDFDGDGDVAEGIAGPIKALHDQLEIAIRTYGAQVAGTAIAYEIHTYPYFFIDGDGDGTASEAEAAFPNRYQSWTPRLLKAAYNYQLVAKDTGIYAHNPHYALQLLYDSLENLSEQIDVDMSGLVRP